MSALYPDDLVLHTDETGEHDLVSFVAGPAGRADIEVADGIVVAVDFAEPGVLNTISTEPGFDRRVLGDLIGNERADEIVASSFTPEGRPRRIIGDPADPRLVSSQPGGRSLPPTEVAEAAVLASLADDEERTDLARAVAHLELHHLASHGLQIATNREVIAERAVIDTIDLLAQADRDIVTLARRDPGLAKQVASRLFEGRDAGLHDLAATRSLLGSHHDEATVVGASIWTVELQSPGRLVVRASDAGGQWVRVLHRDTMVLLALAPMLPDAGRWRADAIVPADLPTELLLVELTETPRPPGSSTLQQFRYAVSLGRQAVQAHVVGHRARASARWMECASAWDQIGDPARAAVARRYAEGQYSPRRPATLSERVEAALRIR